MHAQIINLGQNNSHDYLRSPIENAWIKQGKLLIAAWFLFLTLGLTAGGGPFLIPLYPLGSLAVGLLLFYRAPTLYVSYSLWLFFLGGLIRKIIDQQTGYVTPGRWSLTGFLVLSISLLSLYKYLPKLYTKGGLPFFGGTVSILYAFTVGLLLGRRDLAYIVGFFEYLGPIAFGFHLFVNWRQYPDYKAIVEKTFVWGTAVIGGYAIFQYCVAPVWDVFYLSQINVTSFGRPYPFEIRVFSTFGSPQAFATVMMAGLLLLMGSRCSMKYPASAAGYIGFLLSMARSGWLGWGAGIITFLPFLRGRFQFRFFATFLALTLLVVPIINLTPFAEPIQERIASFSNGGDDTSLSERLEGYEYSFDLALNQMTGLGLGSAGPETALGSADSAIIPLFFSFGWVGAVPYIFSILILILRNLNAEDKGHDTFAVSARAITIGVLAQVWFNNIFSSDFAMILWTFMGIGMAANQYHYFARRVRTQTPSSNN